MIIELVLFSSWRLSRPGAASRPSRSFVLLHCLFFCLLSKNFFAFVWLASLVLPSLGEECGVTNKASPRTATNSLWALSNRWRLIHPGPFQAHLSCIGQAAQDNHLHQAQLFLEPHCPCGVARRLNRDVWQSFRSYARTSSIIVRWETVTPERVHSHLCLLFEEKCKLKFNSTVAFDFQYLLTLKKSQ